MGSIYFYFLHNRRLHVWPLKGYAQFLAQQGYVQLVHKLYFLLSQSWLKLHLIMFYQKKVLEFPTTHSSIVLDEIEFSSIVGQKWDDQPFVVNSGSKQISMVLRVN